MPPVPVQVIAHRGASRDHPENTPIAFEAALRQGCDGIECDLQLTRDGVPVLFHDRDLARLDRPGMRVADLTRAELFALAARAGFYGPPPDESIQTMDEALERFGHRTHLYLEVKTRERGWRGRARHAELMQRAIDGVRRRRLQGRVSILCFDSALLRACAREAPDLPRILNLSLPPAPAGARPVLGVPGSLLPFAPGEIAALSIDVRSLTPEYAAAIRTAGYRLLCFVCNEPEEVKTALAAQAAGIMSDRPGWLRAILAPPVAAGAPPSRRPPGGTP
jgi:glycerophosphoryl diester phosphodiesterase